ncbi:hypothetical protein Barb6XT_02256 [Bacteroidales bacterium Barb6XT]|nr:hypothetical protein Barb6XT_02256 [Bacteroidales bacterium Barb6XT]
MPLPSYPATATNMASHAIRITVPDIPAGALPRGSLTDYTTLQGIVLLLTCASISDSNYTFALPDGWGVSGQDTGDPQTLTLRDPDNIPFLEITNVATRKFIQQ